MNRAEEEFEKEFAGEEGEVGDATFIEAAEDGEELPPAQQLKKLREKLQKAVAEKQEYLDGWQRSRADFANYKREEATLYADREDRTKADLIENLLPALDSFELSLKHASDNKDLAMIYKQLLGSLRSLGVEQFGKAGEVFSPHKHEALREVPTAESEKDHTIESVERSGYSIGDKIIRPAQVSVFTHN